MKVCLDARMNSRAGGVQQFVMGLADGLSRLEDGDEEYFFLTNQGEGDWLRPFVSGPSRIISAEHPLDAKLKMRAQAAAPAAASFLSSFRRPSPRSSDGLIEHLGIDVMHFTQQSAFITGVPSVYQPHDLQHLHHPEFFSRAELRSREALYRIHCERAKVVVVMTSWGKEDLIRHYRLPPASIEVVPPAPLLPVYGNVDPAEDEQVRGKFALPDAFLFYPAQTWPHKNHATLLEALAFLRQEHSLTVPLVCCGELNAYYGRIEERVSALKLAGQTYFLGFVSPAELVSLYRLATAVVFPSKFEGGGMPICEAFWAGTPVACSNVTALPNLAGEAALLFNPDSFAEIAAAIARLWEQEELRATLTAKGRKRASLFSWQKTARMFRAIYRRITGRPLSDEDRDLALAEPLV